MEVRSEALFLLGRTLIYRPTTKDALKRNLKELSTATRFGMFRAKKKILRKADI